MGRGPPAMIRRRLHFPRRPSRTDVAVGVVWVVMAIGCALTHLYALRVSKRFGTEPRKDMPQFAQITHTRAIIIERGIVGFDLTDQYYEYPNGHSLRWDLVPEWRMTTRRLFEVSAFGGCGGVRRRAVGAWSSPIASMRAFEHQGVAMESMEVRLSLWPIVAIFAPSGLLCLRRLTPRILPPAGMCPSCGYNLKGLAIGARCPECGRLEPHETRIAA
ncbi:MAG: hypothetical protein IPK69_12540 [Phycisphaerales bacterium]|nr:MAG: hypothetical protein IPK69_12540 [Phycisphaerales bacterium]